MSKKMNAIIALIMRRENCNPFEAETILQKIIEEKYMECITYNKN